MNFNRIYKLLICLLMITITSGTACKAQSRKNFKATIEGKKTSLYTLKNKQGMKALITNYGARLVSLYTPNRQGKLEDVVLGYDNVMDYHTKGQNFGATVGRYIGRIKGPSFQLDGQTFHLQDDGLGHISHGGKPGFANRVWDVKAKTDTTLTLQYISPDGENGFPGELTVVLTYSLTSDNSLGVEFAATTTKPTVLNLSNHSFFNISGDLTRAITNQQLQIAADSIATFDKGKNLNGHFLAVTGTPFDFRSARTIGDSIDADHEQLKITKGYDHAFKLTSKSSEPAATLYDKVSGRKMEVFTTEPAVQIYTGNGLKGNQKGKHGILYQRRTAICLETEHFADSPNHSNFPSTVLRPGEKYHSKTLFHFSVEK